MLLLISDFELNIDYPGNDLTDGCVVKTDTASECLELCQETAGCKGFSWATEVWVYGCPKGCWIKSEMTGQTVNENVISGFAGKQELLE